MGGTVHISPLMTTNPPKISKTTPSSKMVDSRTSPFQRGKSRVFYASESQDVLRVSGVPSTVEDGSQRSRISPPDSPPDVRQSPSHKSQDSGFSDSGGESNSCTGSFSRLRASKANDLRKPRLQSPDVQNLQKVTFCKWRMLDDDSPQGLITDKDCRLVDRRYQAMDNKKGPRDQFVDKKRGHQIMEKKKGHQQQMLDKSLFGSAQVFRLDQKMDKPHRIHQHLSEDRHGPFGFSQKCPKDIRNQGSSKKLQDVHQVDKGREVSLDCRVYKTLPNGMKAAVKGQRRHCREPGIHKWDDGGCPSLSDGEDKVLDSQSLGRSGKVFSTSCNESFLLRSSSQVPQMTSSCSMTLSSSEDENSDIMEEKSVSSLRVSSDVVRLEVQGPPVTRSLERLSAMASKLEDVRPSSERERPPGSVNALKNHLKWTVKSFNSNYPPCVVTWLQDVRMMTDMECTNVLQNKTFMMAPRNSTVDKIRILQMKCQIVRRDLAQLARELELDDPSSVWSCVQRISVNLQSLLTELSEIGSNVQPTASSHRHLDKLKHLVVKSCNNLLIEAKEWTNNLRVDESNDGGHLLTRLSELSEYFSLLVDAIMTQEIKSVIDCIEEPSDFESLKSAISTLSILGLDGEEMCGRISQVGGVRCLLTICLESKRHQFKSQALRALATICCVIEAIGQLEEVGGVECVTEILCDPSSSETVKSEAAGVIAQITSPAIETNQHIRGLDSNLELLIRALTQLARNTSSEEVLLLSTAALANITFLNPQACHCLSSRDAASIIIDSCQEQTSVFIKDQVATIVANMVAVAECRETISSAGGMALLVAFLHADPRHAIRRPEAQACERVQQKAAIAISRLCTDATIAREITELQGISRLVKLCRDEKERNQSDAVLVACLAALRKIATAQGSVDEFKALDATELVEPRLLDSFLMCSSRQESYV